MRARCWLLLGLATIGLPRFLNIPIAHAHGGIAPGQSLWTAWNTNPLPSLGIFLAAYLYVNGLGKWVRPSHPPSAWQKLSFFSGLLVIFLALQSPIDPLAEHYFSIHQVQHLLLRMLGPLLVLLGAPLTPMLRGLPLWVLQGAVRPVVGSYRVRRAYERLTNPVFTTLLFLSVLYLWQVPAAHNLAVRNDYVHGAMHFTMLFSGFLFWWLVIDPKPHRSRLHYGLRVLYLGLIVIPNTLLGASITFSGGLLYEAYAEVEQPFALDGLIDQQLGGLFLWAVGDMMSILAAGIVMIMWYQKEEERERMDAASQ
ncbi:MAG: cytochrome c oxidase assembly protein [Dehalococcoidia bacterium]